MGAGGGGGGLDRLLYSDVFIGYFTANFVIKHVFLCIFCDYKRPARFCPYCQKSVSGGKLETYFPPAHNRGGGGGGEKENASRAGSF